MTDRSCSVDGCGRVETLRRGMCNQHYRRWKASQADAKPCKLDECCEVAVSRGLCSMHYARLRRTGQHGEAERRVGRFGKALAWLKAIPATDDCIEWPFYVMPNGYGSLHYGDRNRYAHHVSMIVAGMGDRPDGLEACHSCHNRACVNPRHLRWDTHAANLAESVEYRRVSKGTP